MKLNELISARYGCRFPQKYCIPAIHYYREHSRGTRCYFFLEEMERTKNFELHPDCIRYMAETATEGFSELFEAFLYAAYEDVKKNRRVPNGVVIILRDDEN